MRTALRVARAPTLIPTIGPNGSASFGQALGPGYALWRAFGRPPIFPRRPLPAGVIF